MIEILLISIYVLSAILCGYCYYKMTRKELVDNLGIINAGILCTRIITILFPIVNLIVAIAYFVSFLYNTNIKINIKDKNAK